MIASWQEGYDKPRQYVKKQRHQFADKSLYSQGYGLSSSHMWCDSWTMKKAEHRRMYAFELSC